MALLLTYAVANPDRNKANNVAGSILNKAPQKPATFFSELDSTAYPTACTVSRSLGNDHRAALKL